MTDPDRDTGKTCLDGGMHCRSASSLPFLMSLTVLNRNALCMEKISTFHRVWVVNLCALKPKVRLACSTGNISLMTHIRNSVVRCSWIGLVFARRQTTSQ